MRRIGRRNFLQAGAGLLSAMGFAGKAKAGRERRLEYQIHQYGIRSYSFDLYCRIYLECREHGAERFLSIAQMSPRLRTWAWQGIRRNDSRLIPTLNAMNLPSPISHADEMIMLGDIGLMTFEEFEAIARERERRYLVG